VRRSLSTSLIAILSLAVLALGATFASGDSPKLGLDLQGGASVVLAPAKNQSAVATSSLDQAVNIIRRRVNGLGVSEASVSRQGNNILVQLPGVKDQTAALKLVGQTAQLSFRHVLQTVGAGGTYDPVTGTLVTTPAPTVVPATTTTAPASTSTTTAPASTSTTKGALGARVLVGVAAAAQATPAPSGPAATTAASTPAPTPIVPAPTPTAPTVPSLTPKDQITPDKQIAVPQLSAPGSTQVTAIYLLDKEELNGKAVSSASAELSQNLGQGWEVRVNFTGSGGGAFDALAKKYYQQQIAIVLDGVVESAPTINATQFNGTAIISGSAQAGGFTHKQASDLALVLRYGSLPVQLDQQQVQTVSATLGKDSLRAGILAGIIGLILVLLYMVLYYRALGLVVILGLCVSGSLLYATLVWLGQTRGLALSLAGVTGIIVSIGVTVDSYIVYFERLKDEIRSGRSVRASVDRGFARAWRTIVSADAVSFIAAALLYWLTVDQVRGFAFTLGLSTLLDLLVAYTFTRPMVVLLGRNRVFTHARFLGVARGLAAAPAGTPS